MIVDACKNVTVNNCDITNVAGDFVQNPPAANVRLHSRSAGSLDGVVVSTPLTAVGDSFNGFPCKLTYEPTSATTGSGAGGQTVLVVADGAAFGNGDLVNVLLDSGAMFYTSMLSKVGNSLTLAANLPSITTAKAVQRVTPYNAGTVTWADGLGNTLTGTDGVVDGM